eukprot:1666461-Prorocentrum_lima.AAC.1
MGLTTETLSRTIGSSSNGTHILRTIGAALIDTWIPSILTGALTSVTTTSSEKSRKCPLAIGHEHLLGYPTDVTTESVSYTHLTLPTICSV